MAIVTIIEIDGWMDEQLEYLVRAGIYNNKSEAVRDAIRRLLENIDMRNIALKAYKYGNISFQLALDIAGTTHEELTVFFTKHNVIPELGSEDVEEITTGAQLLYGTKRIMLDPLTLELLVKTRMIDILIRNNLFETYNFFITESARTTLRSLSLKRLLMNSERIAQIINVVKKPPNIQSLSKKNGISIAEAEALLASLINNYAYITVDMRTRQIARVLGTKSAPLLSLAYHLYSSGYMEKIHYLEIVSLLETYMVIVPDEVKKL